MFREAYNDDMITGKVPKIVRKRTRENMEWYRLNLYDAFKEAVRVYGKSRNLHNAFMTDDYRLYIPSAYRPEYMDFNKYPLRYSPV